MTASPRELAEEALRDDAKARAEVIQPGHEPSEFQLALLGGEVALHHAVRSTPALHNNHFDQPQKEPT